MIIKTEDILQNETLKSLLFNYVGVDRNKEDFDKICDDGQVDISLKINGKEYNILDFLNEVVKMFDYAVEQEVKGHIENSIYDIAKKLNNISDSVEDLNSLIENRK